MLDSRTNKPCAHLTRMVCSLIRNEKVGRPKETEPATASKIKIGGQRLSPSTTDFLPDKGISI